MTLLEQVTSIREALDARNYSEAEVLARKLQLEIPIDNPLAISAAHYLARALLLNDKLVEAQAFASLADAMHSSRKLPVNDELVIIKITIAQLAEARGELKEANAFFDEVILLCSEPNTQDLIHVPVIFKCLTLSKLGEISEISRTLKKYFPSMKKAIDEDSRDNLRNFWRNVATSSQTSDEISEITRLILNSDVHIELQPRAAKIQDSNFPDGWTEDTISDYLHLTHLNSIATFANKKHSFSTLTVLEARIRVTMNKAKEFMLLTAKKRLGENLSFEEINHFDWLELFFLMRAHAAYLASIRLAMSCQNAETNMVLRGALENALYCFRVSDNPSLKQVWFDKYKDASSLRRLQDQFSIKKIGARMNEINSDLNMECIRLYDYLVDYGGHPNEKTFKALSSTQLNAKELIISVFAVNPDELDLLLDNTIDVGILILEIISLAMPACTAAPPKIEVDRSQIELRAYERWQNRKQSHGNDFLDWVRAEAELQSILI